MDEKSTQKFKCPENEKSFEDKIKTISHHFSRIFVEANETIFFWKVRVRKDHNKFITTITKDLEERVYKIPSFQRTITFTSTLS